MRVINLDETGIKLITANRKQMYISLKQIKDFLDKKYTLSNNRLAFNNDELVLTDSEVEEFDSTYDYIQGIFKKGK
jgi:hypothetical protein